MARILLLIGSGLAGVAIYLILAVLLTRNEFDAADPGTIQVEFVRADGTRV